MSSWHDERGSTMVETIIALSISALLVSVLASLVSALVWLPQHRGDKATVAEDLLLAGHWLTRDANAAERYVAGTGPVYGTFSWSDYTISAKIDYAIIYSFDATNGYVMRSEQQNGVEVSTFAVARNVASVGDVVFSWNPSTYSLQVTVKSTVATGTVIEGVSTTSRTAAITVALRPRAEYAMAPPGLTPVPTPAPGSQDYYVSAAPIELTGSYVSGGLAQLQSSDGSYYVVNSTSGVNKQVVYAVRSQSLTLPLSVSQIAVRFTGNSDRTNTATNFYVQDSAAGFPSLPESGFTFATASEARVHSFYLSPAALSYVTSLADRRVDLKVSASANANFVLSSDQIVFTVSP